MKFNVRGKTFVSPTRSSVKIPNFSKGLLVSGLLSLGLFVIWVLISSESKTPPLGAMMKGFHGWKVTALFTVGERLPTADQKLYPNHYRPVGVLDGLGAFRLTSNTVRVLINHELRGSAGYAYALKNGTTLTGARISFVDLDPSSRRIVNSGRAYDSVFDRQGEIVTDAPQINQRGKSREGFSRFCSSTLLEGGTYGFLDTLYFAGEEIRDPLSHPYGGSLWVLDVKKGILHGVPATGRMNFENIAPLNIHGNRVAMLIGDDSAPQTDAPDNFGQVANAKTPPEYVVAAPLWLYIGNKNASLLDIREALPPGIRSPTSDFLNRNGLLAGKLYYFVADDGITTVTHFKGTGSVISGAWRELKVFDTSKANQDGFDEFGYKNGFTLRREAKAGGAFQFSRPEDVSTHRTRGTRVALASTGRASVSNGHDSWGTIYQVDVDLNTLRATLTIVYDGDDAGGGKVKSPDHGIRSPDNLDWAHDGFIYVQEDNAKQGQPIFGSVSGEEASIWRLNPKSGDITRIAQMDRSRIIPAGTIDQKPHIVGVWESSGILDVSKVFETKEGEKLFLATVLAHTIQDGVIQEANLVEGGQLIFLQKNNTGEMEVGFTLKFYIEKQRCPLLQPETRNFPNRSPNQK